jgi:hypothetical protein
MKTIKKTSMVIKKLAAILLLAAAAVVVGLIVYKNRPVPASPETTGNNVTSAPSTQEEKDEAEQNKLNKIENPTDQTPATDRVVISSVSQDPNTEQVVVKTELYGSEWQKCTLTMSQGATKITREANTLYQTTFSSCLGFAINVNDFPAGGTWSAILTAYKNDGSSVASSAVEVTITK